MTEKYFFTLLIVEDETDLASVYGVYAKNVFEKVLIAENYQSAHQLLSSHTIHCILLDNFLPDGRGIDLINDFNLKDKKIPIIVITANPNMRLAIEAINLGVCHFLEKPVSMETLTKTLRMCKNLLLKEKELSKLDQKFKLHDRTKIFLVEKHGLSTRECEIVSQIMELQDNKTIAKNLHISEKTVKRHFENIFKKISIKSRKELRQFIYEQNLSLSSEDKK